MNLDRPLKELSEEELNDFLNGIKYARFQQWVNTLEHSNEAKLLAKEIEDRVGYPQKSPGNLMVLAFFAGIDTGAEMIEAITEAKETSK